MGWADRYIAEIQSGRTVSFRPRGNSMGAHVPNGALVTVGPLTRPLKSGDIVLCRVAGNQYLHFAAAVVGDRVRIENARGRSNDWTTLKHIYGILVRVEP